MEKKEFDLQEELKNLPTGPGVYLHHDELGEIIYVGKAKNLKNRVSQYFQTRDRSAKIGIMVKKIAWFEYIMTESEDDALLLENRLIKKYMPRYNTLLKDGKTYPYIKLTVRDDFPRLLKVRNVKKDGGKYYGPYPHEGAVNEIILLLNSVYHLRTCQRKLPEDIGKKRACLSWHLGKCDAPCEGRICAEEYAARIADVKKYLDGNSGDIIELLKKRMEEASAAMEYEKAAEYRDLIKSAKGIKAELSKRKDWQVLLKDEEKIRREDSQTRGAVEDISEMLGIPYAHRMESYDISNIQGTESVGSMVVYEDGRPKKTDYRKFKIKTVQGADDYASMAEVLERRFTHNERHANDAAKHETGGETSAGEAEKTGAETKVCKGTKAGEAEKAGGETKAGEAEKAGGETSFDRLPDLLMIDGGKGQVHVVLEVIRKLARNGHPELGNITVCGMVKDDHHRTRGIFCNETEYPMDRSSDAFKLVTRIQDETHRFAIEYHRMLRSKGQVRSVLDGIDGIGPKRRLALMRHFKTLDAIKEATEEELAAAPSMNAAAAKSVKEFFETGIV